MGLVLSFASVAAAEEGVAIGRLADATQLRYHDARGTW